MNAGAPALLLAVFIVVLSAAGCTSSPGSVGDSKNGTTIITDDTGTAVAVPKYPTRVVSLAPSETEIFYAVNTNNTGISLVGRTDYDDYPSQVYSVPSVGGPQTLGVESIVSKDPDLILATTVADKTIIQQLRSLGYPVLIFSLEDFNDIYNNIEDVGKALGLQGNADNVVKDMKAVVSEIQNSPHADPEPRTMYVVSIDPLYVAGGVNIFADKNGYFIASDEAIIDRQPEVIIVPYNGMGGGLDIKSTILSNKDLSDIPAVKNGRVYEVDDDLVSRPGPRITEGLERFYQCINGETQ